MTREEKTAYKIERAKKRRSKRMSKYVEKIQAVRNLPRHVSLSQYNNMGDIWEDPDSPTGWSQKCDYEAWGSCQYPCNGDC